MLLGRLGKVRSQYRVEFGVLSYVFLFQPFLKAFDVFAEVGVTYH